MNSGVRIAEFRVRKRKRSSVTGTLIGAPFSFQSGMSSPIARGSITAPERMWAPISEPFSSTHTEVSGESCFTRIAAARPAGPPPTTTTSYCIDSRLIAQNYNQSSMAPRKLMHVERIEIRWGDMDAMGHVNNTVYFRYMEQARIGWFDTLVPRADAWKVTGIVIANASCNFKRPINYPGTVEVKLLVGPPGGSSVPTFYELKVDNALYADGAATVVFIDMRSQKPIRIPEAIRELLKEGIK